MCHGLRAGAVGTVTALRAGRSSLVRNAHAVLGVHTGSCLFGTGVRSRKWISRGVKNEWSYTSAHIRAFMAWAQYSRNVSVEAGWPEVTRVLRSGTAAEQVKYWHHSSVDTVKVQWREARTDILCRVCAVCLCR
jgi:hypothetical protein